MVTLFYFWISVIFFTWSFLRALKKHYRGEELTSRYIEDMIMAALSLIWSMIYVTLGWQI